MENVCEFIGLDIVPIYSPMCNRNRTLPFTALSLSLFASSPYSLSLSSFSLSFASPDYPTPSLSRSEKFLLAQYCSSLPFSSSSYLTCDLSSSSLTYFFNALAFLPIPFTCFTYPSQVLSPGTCCG